MQVEIGPVVQKKDDMKSITDNFWHYFLTKEQCTWDGIMQVDKELTAWIVNKIKWMVWCEMVGSYKL